MFSLTQLSTHKVQVIDFSLFLHGNSEERKLIADQIHFSFRETGFMYLKNHGVNQSTLEHSFSNSKKFFDLSVDQKQKLAWSGDASYFEKSGYVSLEKETLDLSSPGDFKEMLDIGKTCGDEWNWPLGQEAFKGNISILYQELTKTANTILEALALALDLPDLQYFSKTHDDEDHELRFIFYPPINRPLKTGQLRAGAHTDYGSITLLFQDQVGGLEVKLRSGEWVSVPYLPNTMVVNVGNLLQRWTNDKYCSNPHRVIPPTTEQDDNCRYSIAFFCHPNSRTIISCLPSCQSPESPPRYPSVLAGDYIIGLLQATIQPS
jgi:isopenicillin N synthase-like dioxygenase